MSRLTRDGTAEPVSRDQIFRHARGQGNIHFPYSADHEQDWQPYPVDPYSCHMCDHTSLLNIVLYKACRRMGTLGTLGLGADVPVSLDVETSTRPSEFTSLSRRTSLLDTVTTASASGSCVFAFEAVGTQFFIAARVLV